MEHLVGKKLALVPDVKLDGRANVTLIIERLLTTIGEDDQAINRKHKPYWQGKLGIRWLILGNEVPRFRGTDENGGLDEVFGTHSGLAAASNHHQRPRPNQ
jgi:putative DNA primase/helicase